MTVQNPPSFIQASLHPANGLRLMTAALATQGVCGAGDLKVTQAGSPAMTVVVAGGTAFVPGSLASDQGTYCCFNNGTTTLTISAAHATNARIDRIVAQVEDAAYTGATNAWKLSVVTGTPSGSPVAPAVPANAITLATVAVAALATTIVNANITDLRPRSSMLGGPPPCTSTTRPAAPFTGQTCFETNTTKTMMYSGSAWVCIGRLSGRDTWTPVVGQSVSTPNIANSVVLAEYEVINNICHAWWILNITGTGTAGFGVTVSMPVAAVGATFRNVGAGLIYDTSIGSVDIVSYQLSTLGNVSGASSRGAGDWGQTPSIAIAFGDILRGEATFPIA